MSVQEKWKKSQKGKVHTLLLCVDIRKSISAVKSAFENRTPGTNSNQHN